MRFLQFVCTLVFVALGTPAFAQMTITLKGDVATMKGRITGNECDELWLLLQKNKSIKTIELTSHGGNSASGHCTGMLIRRYKLNTVAIDYCTSACSYMWLGGISRKLSGRNTYLGTHGAYSTDDKKELSHRLARLGDVWVLNMAPNVDRALLEQWVRLPKQAQVMRFYQDRAELCDGRDCTPIPGRNIKNAGLSTD